MTRSTRQTTWCVGRHQQTLRVMNNYATAWRDRSGFTLVELLVVIAIIGVLAALIVPAVFQARVSAKNAAIKAEIDMLHMAIMNYKNEFGSFPPCIDTRYDGINPPSTAALNTDVYQNNGEAAKHISRLFPRCTGPTSELNAASVNDPSRTVRLASDTVWLAFLYPPGQVPAAADLHLTPHNAIHAWLVGYTASPVNPLTAGQRKKIFDFDESRVSAGLYAPSEKPDSPFIYIDSSKYDTLSAGAPGSTTLGAIQRELNEYYNPDSFQILCAGQDEIWGTEDDLSNFWKGTRGDQ